MVGSSSIVGRCQDRLAGWEGSRRGWEDGKLITSGARWRRRREREIVVEMVVGRRESR
jgi:hypothetical protein